MALPETLAVTPTEALVRDVNALFGREVAGISL